MKPGAARSTRRGLALAALVAGVALGGWALLAGGHGRGAPGGEGRAGPAVAAAAAATGTGALPYGDTPGKTLFRLADPAAVGARDPAESSVPVVVSRQAALAGARRGMLDIALPDGTRYPLAFERGQAEPGGNWTFVGRVETALGTLASVITFGPDGVFGTLPTPDGATLKLTTRGGQAYLQPEGWTIPPGADPSLHLDYVLPDAGLAPAGMAIAAAQAGGPPAAPASVAAPGLASADGPATITILAAYTRNLVQLRGSESAAQTEYRNLVAVMNQAHIDSGTRARFEIAGFVQLNYPATSHNDVARQHIIANTLPDGTDLHRLRDQVAADLVAMIRPYVIGDLTCGISQFPGQSLAPHALDRSTGFSVSAVEACAPLVFAHEIGHNLGLMHDRDTVAGAHGATLAYGAFPFSFGHRQHGPPGFATVMAYDSESRPRLGYFSHPGTTLCGGAACGDAALSDNVRSIDLVAGAIARFRDPPGSISIADRWIRESDASYAVNIDVNLSSPAPAGGVTFDIALEGGSAAWGEDFEPWANASLEDIVIPQGAMRGTLRLRVLQDDKAEPTEWAGLRLGNVRGAVKVLDDFAMLGIVDDDSVVRVGGTVRFPPGAAPPPSVGVQAREVKDGVSRAHYMEAAAPGYDYGFDVAQGAHVTLRVAGDDGLAMPDVVFEDLAASTRVADLRLRTRTAFSGTLRTPAGQPVSGVPVILWNGNGDGSGYYVNWAAGGYRGPYRMDVLTGVAMQAEVRNPPAPYVRQVVELPPLQSPASRDIQLRTVPSLTIPHVAVVEGDAADGERTVLLTASLSVPRSETGVTFDLQVGGTADAGDYRLPATRLTIPRYRSRVEVPVVIRGDDRREPDETIELRITNITGAAWNPGPGSVRIVNDDPVPGGAGRCSGAAAWPAVPVCE